MKQLSQQTLIAQTELDICVRHNEKTVLLSNILNKLKLKVT